MDTLDPSPAPTFALPDAEVPDLEFAGIKAQYAALKDVIAPRLAEVFSHGRFILGPEIEALEAALADFAGCNYAVGVSSGTDALIAPMLAAGVGPGDAVFLPAFTFTATAEVPILLGAAPVYVDVDPRTYNIDPLDLQARIDAVKAEGRLRPKAVVPVDLFGLPADYDAIASIAAAEDLFLLADAAQSFGGALGDRPVGSLAPVTATSFFPAKPLGCYGDGGAVFTDDAHMRDLLVSIRMHGQGAERYAVDRIGLNARLDSLQAAILLAKLPALPAEIRARNGLADLYDDYLSEVAVTPVRSNEARCAFAQYTIQIENRDSVQERLTKADIPTAIYYPKPMHLQPPYAPYGDGLGSLPVSETIAERVLALPMHGYMRDDVAHRIGETVRAAIKD